MIASFGDKIFEVSWDKIYTPKEIQMSESLNYETQERTGDKPAIYVKSQGALEIPLSVRLDAQFVDVEQEMVYWLLKMRSAQPEILTLGNRPWGTGKCLLTKWSVANLKIAGNGVYTAAELSLTFIEYPAEGRDEDGNTATTGAGIQAARIMLNEMLVKS